MPRVASAFVAAVAACAVIAGTSAANVPHLRLAIRSTQFVATDGLRYFVFGRFGSNRLGVIDTKRRRRYLLPVKATCTFDRGGEFANGNRSAYVRRGTAVLWCDGDPGKAQAVNLRTGSSHRASSSTPGQNPARGCTAFGGSQFLPGERLYERPYGLRANAANELLLARCGYRSLNLGPFDFQTVDLSAGLASWGAETSAHVYDIAHRKHYAWPIPRGNNTICGERGDDDAGYALHTRNTAFVIKVTASDCFGVDHRFRVYSAPLSTR